MARTTQTKKFKTAKQALRKAEARCRDKRNPSPRFSAKHYEMRQLIRAICQDTYDEATAHWQEAVQAVCRFQTAGAVLPAADWLAERLAEDGVGELKRIAVYAAALDLWEARQP